MCKWGKGGWLASGSRRGKDIKLSQKRKKEHLRIALSDGAQIGNPGFDKYRFIHNALPEINFESIDTSTVFLNKKVNYPFFISCMTGGIRDGERLNKNLAKAAHKYGIAMGVGSQRVAIEKPELAKTFKVVRKYAPDIPVLANVGLVQLNYGFGLNEIGKIISMVSADALVFHINPIQEAIQPEGDRNFENLFPKLSKIINNISVPVIVKEVGFGLSEGVVRRLYKAGVRIFDTAGWGGTNWAYIEGQRVGAKGGLGELLSQWGISTAQSIKECKKVKDDLKDPTVVILGSGGVRTGLDIAKSIALGSDLVGIALPFAKAALVSEKEVENLIEKLANELKVSMFGIGAKDIADIKKEELVISNE